ncbi:MAG: RluA family pseudouridine synthase [Lachnospiraceae bacterium]|nr:RluA family pseudouridine synthase [Lachnospiraceae bacterium]
MTPEIVFKDKDVCVAFKPAGYLSQADKSTDPDMVSFVTGECGRDVHIINRLDRPVSGLMLFALNERAAKELSKQVSAAGAGMCKEYIAYLSGVLQGKSGELRDFIGKAPGDQKASVMKKTNKGAKEAVLKYKTLRSAFREGRQFSLVRIELVTGRYHQIRVQTSSRGAGICGDTKYNPDYADGKSLPGDGFSKDNRFTIALTAVSLEFTHPVTKKKLTFRLPKDKFGWNCDMLKDI